MRQDRRKNGNLVVLATMRELMMQVGMTFTVFNVVVRTVMERRCRISTDVNDFNPFQAQVDNKNRLVRDSEVNCIEQLRMDRQTFRRLCCMAENFGGLSHSKYVLIEEKLAMFLYILAHHKNNRCIKYIFVRSGQTVSKYFNQTLQVVLRLHDILLAKPEPIPQDSGDNRWRVFQNCVGSLDGTYVNVRVPNIDKPRYRNRKGLTATNVLGVCAPNMQFIYILPGWEGSTADSRVLKDAIARPNGLKVPQGCYYLVDGGYTNGEGFLSPYRGQRYHLKEWKDGPAPNTPKEYFNMKHAQARNVIERCFGLLKTRWAIMRSPSYFSIQVQGRLVIACALLHNHIRREMSLDPLESMIPEINEDEVDDHEYIDRVKGSDEWTSWRDTLAEHMYNDWLGVV